MSVLPTPHEGPTTGEPAPTFQRQLGLFDATMLIVGTMIGSGIFVTSVAISRDVGTATWLLLVWALAGFMTIIGALSYAELASMMPHAGGQYVFLREAYSPLWGFLYGWTCFLVIQTGSIAAVAVVFAKYLGVFVPQLGTDNKIFVLGKFTISAGQLVAVVVLLLLTLLNCRGVREGKWVQNIFTVTKTLALIVLIVVGLFLVASPRARELNFQDTFSGIEKTGQYDTVKNELAPRWLIRALPDPTLLLALMVMGGAMVGALFSADAWNNVTFTAGEVRNPSRNLPRSLALGTGLVITLYLLANLAYVEALPLFGAPGLDEQVRALDRQEEELRKADKTESADTVKKQKEELLKKADTFNRGIVYAKDERVGTAVMELWSPRAGAWFMAAAIMISTFGCVNGMILMGARLYYVMARDRLFFQSVGTLNRRSVPGVALVLQGAWSVLLVFSGTYDELLDFVIFAVLVFYVLTVIGLFVLRRRRPDLERPYRAFGYPVLPAVYVLLCAAIMLDLLIVKPRYTWPGLIIVLTGVPVYFVWRRTLAQAPDAEPAKVPYT